MNAALPSVAEEQLHDASEKIPAVMLKKGAEKATLSLEPAIAQFSTESTPSPESAISDVSFVWLPPCTRFTFQTVRDPLLTESKVLPLVSIPDDTVGIVATVGCGISVTFRVPT
jgi:hypothetical protein